MSFLAFFFFHPYFATQNQGSKIMELCSRHDQEKLSHWSEKWEEEALPNKERGGNLRRCLLSWPSSGGSSQCYSRQVARYEQRKAGTGQVAGNHASCKQWGVHGRTQKSRNPQTVRKRHILGWEVSWRQTKKGGARQESPASECNLLLIMLSLQ